MSNLDDMNRRNFLAMLAAIPFAANAAAADSLLPIIDSHIHLFDRTRPQGAFWPPKDDPVPGVSALPSRYRAIASPFGIVGAIVVEASPWVEDNQWVLDQAANAPIILGHVGFLDPGTSDFGTNLERFHKNKLYLGIRYSNRNNREGGNIAAAVDDATFLSNLKLLADARLSLDLAMPADPTVLIRLTDKIPALRIIVPHLPNARMPAERVELEPYLARLRELGSRPRVYMKLSEVIKRVDGKPSTNLTLYQERLDQLWDIFGEDRVMFGSDWPNSEHVAALSDVMTVARAYIARKSVTAFEKVFWRNSAAAYRWVPRDSTQPRQ